MSSKILDTNLYMQKSNLNYCSVNAVRTILEYYFEKPPTRATIKKKLKTDSDGTFSEDILEVVSNYNLLFDKVEADDIDDKLLLDTIKNNNLILISYMAGLDESHSSVICGYKKIKGITYTVLCDSWLGYYEIPFSMLKVLMDKDNAMVLVFNEV